mgnify:CR=1 FL=1
MHDCIFCKIAKGEIKSEIVDESNNFLAFYDINPKTAGHTLIIPKKHFVTLLDIPSNLGEELLSFTKHISGFLLEKKFGDGFNILMNNLPPAGQVVMHAHIHILPRKESDNVEPVD